MFLILHGPDAYRRLEKKREIVREFVAKHPMGHVVTVDAEGDSFKAQFSELAGTQSLFDPVMLIDLENAYALEKKDITAYLAPHIGSSTIVVLISEDSKPTKDFDAITAPKEKAAKKSAATKTKAVGKKAKEPAGEPKKPIVIMQEFAYFEGAQWQAYVKALADKAGVVLTKPALVLLTGIYEKNTWGLVTELQKIASLSKKEIDSIDIEGADSPEVPSFFAMIGALKHQDIKVRLSMLEKLIALGDPAAKTFHMLAYQSGNVMQFAKYDFFVKSGKLEYDEVLLDALL